MIKSILPTNLNQENVTPRVGTTPTTRRRAYSFSRTQKWKPILLLRIIWCLALVYGELLVFYLAMWKCRWPDLQEWDTKLAQPYHIALIADPQIIDEYSYGREGILQWFSEVYPDMYIRKNWHILQQWFEPDSAFVLGDLLDGGRELDDQKWNAEMARFQSLLRRKNPDKTKMFYLAGNHDIGFGQKIVPNAYLRWRRLLGKTNYLVEMGNHTVVVVDSVALSSDNESLQSEAIQIVERMGKHPHDLPRILMTHVPLYRPPETDCGPLRQNGRYISQAIGYQFQNLITEETSQYILDNVRPSIVFSGDDHDYCEVQHQYSAGGFTTEITVNTFSFAMGLPNPGFVLLSLYNPTDQSTDHSLQTFAHAQCLLPDQVAIYFSYIYLLIATVIIILIYHYIRFRQTNTLNTPLPLIEQKFKQKQVWIITSIVYWKACARPLINIALVGCIVYMLCWIWWVI